MDNELGTSAETYHPTRMRLNVATGGGIDSVRSQGTQQHECTYAQPDCTQQESYRGRAYAGGAGINSGIPSPQSSPRSAALPSPPDSPAPSVTDSMSSFPSVGSSFFFSSGAASPHHAHAPRGGAGAAGRRRTHYSVSDPESGVESGGDPMHALIIPSLSLPAPVPQPTAHGQTLGEVLLLLVGNAERGHSGARALAEFLADADDVVDACDWEDYDGDVDDDDCNREADSGEASNNARGRKARVLHASTDWLEERDLHGLEQFEGTKNVAFVELEDIKDSESTEAVIQSISQRVLDVFRDTSSHLAGSPSSSLLHALLASGNSTLCTALVYITSSPQSPRDKTIISSLAKLLPVIPLSTSSVSFIQAYRDHDVSPHRQRHLRASHYDSPFPITSNPTRSHSQSREHEREHSRNVTDSEAASTSPFTPHTPSALRAGLFRAPHALASLRTEAASRFLRWREVERALGEGAVESGQLFTSFKKTEREGDTWSKREWEMELSADYAHRLHEIRRRSPLPHPPATPDEANSGFVPALDPLHLSSVVLLSLSLLTPSRTSRAMLFPERQQRKQVLVPSQSLSSSAAQLEVSAREQTHSSHGPAHAEHEPKMKRKRRWTSAVKWGIVLVGAFCAGVGFGLVLSSSTR